MQFDRTASCMPWLTGRTCSFPLTRSPSACPRHAFRTRHAGLFGVTSVALGALLFQLSIEIL